MASCPVLSILQGFSHVPKRPGGLKPELIDVDLVIGTVCFSFFRLKIIYIYFFRYNVVQRKKQINYKFIPTDLFREPSLIRGFKLLFDFSSAQYVYILSYTSMY